MFRTVISFISSGGLLRDITIDQVKSGFSKIRNKGLAEALVNMKEVEGWGGGVARYFEACANMGLPPPKVAEDAGIFKVVFFRDGKGVIDPGKGVIVSEKEVIDSKKGVIAPEKGVIERRLKEIGCSRPRIETIMSLHRSLPDGAIFGHAKAMAATGLEHNGASKLIAFMRDAGLIEPVKGHGKGKYRFASFLAKE